MKLSLFLSGIVLLGVTGWQRWKIQDLHAVETALRAAQEASKSCATADSAGASTGTDMPAHDPIPDAELPGVLATLRGVESSIQRSGNYEREIEVFRTEQSDLMKKLVRLTPAQAASIFDDWMGEEKDPRSHHSHVVTRTALIFGHVNPSAALELAANRIKGAAIFHSRILSNWFLEDPKALAKWVDEWRARTPKPADPEFARAASTWAALAGALDDPAVGAREFAAACDRTTPLVNGLSELGSKMESNEARLVFLRSLHAATDGKFVPYPFVIGAAKRSTFAQVAHLLDQAPAFEIGKGTDRYSIDDTPPGLRLVAAHWSQDATPKVRWDWLSRRPEDVPAGEHLKNLVDQWARHDDPGTTEWLASLSPGPTRDSARKYFADWQRSNKPGKR
jgi:hypothetical protein